VGKGRSRGTCQKPLLERIFENNVEKKNEAGTLSLMRGMKTTFGAGLVVKNSELTRKELQRAETRSASPGKSLYSGTWTRILSSTSLYMEKQGKVFENLTRIKVIRSTC